MEAKGKGEPGLHHVTWNLRRGGAGGGRGGRGGGGGGGGFLGGFGVSLAAPGMYRVVLTVDDKEFSQGLKVEADPTLNGVMFAVEPEKEDPDEDAYDPEKEERKEAKNGRRIDD
jgi:hypothetical protein